jgi:hypothetical protein
MFFILFQLTGSVRIKAVPFISYKPEDQMERIKHLGIMMKGLLAARENHKRFLEQNM